MVEITLICLKYQTFISVCKIHAASDRHNVNAFGQCGNNILRIRFRMVDQIADGRNLRIWFSAQTHGGHAVKFIRDGQNRSSGQPFAAVYFIAFCTPCFDHLRNHCKRVGWDAVRICVRMQQRERFFTVFCNCSVFNIRNVFAFFHNFSRYVKIAKIVQKSGVNNDQRGLPASCPY